jgi:hypothetical protein
MSQDTKDKSRQSSITKEQGARKITIPLDNDQTHDDEVVKVRPTQSIRIHVYLGSLCRSEMFDKNRDFEKNKAELLDKFGIGSRLTTHELKQAEYSKYVLKLVNGGQVDSNNLVFHDDRVIILPQEEFLRDQDVKQEEG